MGRKSYSELVGTPEKVLALTSLSVEEFAELVGPFEHAFQAHMAEWTLEGKRRQNRRYSPYRNSPLPTPEDRLFFILSYLKQNPTQAYHGVLFDLPQNKVNQWVHTLFPVLRTALRLLGDAPARHFSDVLARLDALAVAEAESVPSQPTEPTPPLFATTEPSVPSRAPTTRLNKPAFIAARKSSTRSRTSS